MTPTNIKTVDMEILSVVYNAAVKRLERIREAELKELGVARTSMTDVGRQVLVNWKPSMAPKVPAPRRPDTVTVYRSDTGQLVGECTVCPKKFRGATREQMREHAAEHTKTFRFGMSRAAYDRIKDEIHNAGLSVSAVVQDGLEKFARNGSI